MVNTLPYGAGLDSRLKESFSPRDGVRGIEKPKALYDLIPENNEQLKNLAGRHIVSIRQFDRETIVQLCKLAASYESQGDLIYKPLAGKIMISAFYEPSTRTRLSFESAFHRLGGDIMSITDRSTTGIAKGESLSDIGEMFTNYGDVVVLRDSERESVFQMIENLKIPIINAGNGIDEHPTQALADLYAILKWKPELAVLNKQRAESEKLTIGVIGVPGRMRTVRSLLLTLGLFSDCIQKLIIINPDHDIFDEQQKEELLAAGLKIEQSTSLRKVAGELDVVYINSIAWIGDTYEKLAGDITLNKQTALKKDSIILHPLARGEELDVSLDKTPHNWYFAQARGAVFLRMALLTCLTQRINLVADSPVDRPEENI